jgi:hypothetical protein
MTHEVFIKAFFHGREAGFERAAARTEVWNEIAGKSVTNQYASKRGILFVTEVLALLVAVRATATTRTPGAEHLSWSKAA